MRGIARLRPLLASDGGRDRRMARRSEAPVAVSAALLRAAPAFADLWKARRCSSGAGKSVRADSRYRHKGHAGLDTVPAHIGAPTAPVGRPTVRYRQAYRTTYPTAGRQVR